MKMSAAGLDLLKGFEGLKLRAYLDPVGIWTVGYGHTSAAGAPAGFCASVMTAISLFHRHGGLARAPAEW